MSLPFTTDQFLNVFAAYNRVFWPVVLALWVYALAGAVLLAQRRPGRARWIAVMLAVQWTWAGLVYHAAFFAAINPAAWVFSGLFLCESALLVWVGVVHDQLQFSQVGSPRHVLSWVLIAYALLYPAVAYLEGHTFPGTPTFGVPCPTTLLTIGFFFAVDPPLPRVITIIPTTWAVIGGSAAVFLGVRADLMLWVAGLALQGYLLTDTRARVHA